VTEQRLTSGDLPHRFNWLRVICLCMLVGMVAACTTMKKPPPLALPVPEPKIIVVKPAEATIGLAPRDRINLALTLMERGDLKQARLEVAEYLRERPNSELGKSLLSQLDMDPKILFGPTSFAYKIKSGESLYELAERFMGDQFKFIGLARYNGIAVPERAIAGEIIQIPGDEKTIAAVNGKADLQAEIDKRLASEAPKPEPEVKVVAPAPPPKPAEPSFLEKSRANGLRKSALEQLQRGFADKAAGLLEEALKLFPNSQLIKKDLERAKRLQTLSRQTNPR
jgi:tetratricopeptide (TPR) repeat protein